MNEQMRITALDMEFTLDEQGVLQQDQSELQTEGWQYIECATCDLEEPAIDTTENTVSIEHPAAIITLGVFSAVAIGLAVLNSKNKSRIMSKEELEEYKKSNQL